MFVRTQKRSRFIYFCYRADITRCVVLYLLLIYRQGDELAKYCVDKSKKKKFRYYPEKCICLNKGLDEQRFDPFFVTGQISEEESSEECLEEKLVKILKFFFRFRRNIMRN